MEVVGRIDDADDSEWNHVRGCSIPVDLMQDARQGQGIGHYERGRELWSLQSQEQQELGTDLQQKPMEMQLSSR